MAEEPRTTMALPPLPETMRATRHDMMRLATHVIYLTRRAATGRYGLRSTPGGFGTPFFGADEQVRVEGVELVHQTATDVRRTPITTLRAAAEFVGRSIDPDFDHGFRDVVDLGDPDADLAIDPAAADALGAWFGFGDQVLEVVRAEWADRGPSVVQLWPEHFDIALDVAYGEPAAEQRLNVGASPGDGGHEEPYLYVGPWTADRPGDPAFWNVGFGAVLGYRDVAAAGSAHDQRAVALEFLRRGMGLLRDAR